MPERSYPVFAGPLRAAALALDAPSNSTTTGTRIDGLSVPGLGAGFYVCHWYLVYQAAATTTGVKFGVNFTGAGTIVATLRWGTTGTTASTNAPTQSSVGSTLLEHASARAFSTTAPNLGPSASVDTANANMLAIIDAVLSVTAAGQLELWHASEVAAASTVKAGSCVLVSQMG